MILKYLLTTLNICGLFCLFVTPIVASAASNTVTVNKVRTSTVVVDATTGKVKSPQNFVEANKLVTSEVVCLRIDMIDMKSKVEDNESNTFTDAELKILDETGKLLYFATTLKEDVDDYHDDDGTYDANCKIYYYVSGNHYNQSGCSNPKREYTLNYDGIGGTESNGKIIAIEFYPNLSGTLTLKDEDEPRSIRNIVLNPNNTIIVSRKGDGVIERERDVDGRRIWRPVTIQYYTIPLKPSSNGGGN